MTNKYLEKIAISTAAFGAVAGGLAGATTSVKHPLSGSDLTAKQRLAQGIVGAAIGGLLFHGLKKAKLLS